MKCMFGAFILIAISLFHLPIALAQRPSSLNSIDFDLPNKFYDSDVVLVGWTHVAWNGFVPSRIMDDLNKINKNLVIITEDTPIQPVELCTSATRGPEYVAMLLKARSLGVELVGGEPPLPGLEANFQPWSVRNEAYAEAIEKFVKQGKKVLLIIGDKHVPFISQLLEGKQIESRSVRTNIDLSNRIVWGELVLGRKGDPIPRRETDLKFYDDVVACPRLTCVEQGNNPQFCEEHGF